MSEQTERTLPTAASITYLKNEAKALRAAFDGADAAARTRVGAHVSPVPTTLAQAQALFVIAREYGFRSWPALKRHVERQTRTVFSDAEGAAEVFAELLGDANVTIAASFEEALESTSEVVLLDLHVRRDKPFPESRHDELRARKLVVTGPWANELCRELDLEIGGGNVIEGQPLRVLDSTLLGGAWSASGENSIEPFAELDAPSRADGWREQSLHFRHIPEELRLRGESGFVEVLVAPADRGDEVAIVAREANCVFAGVTGHPERWSDAYRRVFVRVVSALADRERDVYRPAIVPRAVHEPGTIRFRLDASTGFWANDEESRYLHFQFDRPTVFTATLKHHGSDEVALTFSGGRKQLYGIREDGGPGETLTIALTIAQPAIDAMAGRHWRLRVDNYDMDNGMSAELTVRYDALEGGAILPLPSDSSFEHAHWFAERLVIGEGDVRRQETARTFGFDDWTTLQTHVAWRGPTSSAGVVHGCDMRFARAQEQFGNASNRRGSISAHDIAEFMASSVEMSADVRAALLEAGALAETRQHGSVDVEHLLFILLDNHADR